MSKEIIKCPLCKSASVKFKHYLFDDNSLSWTEFVAIHECRKCNLTFSVLESEISDIYSNDYYVFHKQRESADIAFSHHCCQWLNARFPVSGKRLLDVGCGKGFFCEVAKQAGAIVTGLEPSKKITEEVIKRTGLNIINALFEELEYRQNYYDILTMWDVLEHLKDPDDGIKKASALLKENGILAISVPNHSSIFALLAGPFWKGYNFYHISHFEPQRLVRLLEKHGFRKRFLETYDNTLFSSEALFRMGIKDRMKAVLVKFPKCKNMIMKRRANLPVPDEVFTGHNDYLKNSNRNFFDRGLIRMIKYLKLGDQIRILAIKDEFSLK